MLMLVYNECGEMEKNQKKYNPDIVGIVSVVVFSSRDKRDVITFNSK